MLDKHSSFLIPFFVQMNIKFENKWCVLHSYETLPYYSESDVDMALDSIEIQKLEEIIFDVALENGWQVVQKLWYDTEKCFYYVLFETNKNNFLAIDFLVDKYGTGRYGFESSLLTNNCNIFKEIIPIPNNEIAFVYKFTKRLIKNIDFVNEISYMNYHFSKSKFSTLQFYFEKQFGKKSFSDIKKTFQNKNLNISDELRVSLLKNRDINLNRNVLFVLKKNIFEFNRILFRILFPSGMIIVLPTIFESKSKQISLLLEEKLSLSFRFYKQINSSSFLKFFKSMAGSTLVISFSKKNNSIIYIRSSWFLRYKFNISNKALQNNDLLTDEVKALILNILTKRLNSRR